MKAVRLHVTSRPRTITIHGSAEDTDWAKAVLEADSSQATDSEARVQEIFTCAVC